MPWGLPGPFTSGQLVTAAHLNAFRDSLHAPEAVDARQVAGLDQLGVWPNFGYTVGRHMTALYDVILKDGLEETRQERAFPAELLPGNPIHIDGSDWVVVQIRERAGLTPELIAVPAEFLS